MNLELELVRHITNGNYLKLRNEENFQPKMLQIDLPALTIIRVLVDYVEDSLKSKSSKALSEAVLRHEFSWLEDKHFEEPETDISFVAEKMRARYVKFVHRALTLELADATPEDYQKIFVRGQKELQGALASNAHQARGNHYLEYLERRKDQNRKKIKGISLGFREVNDHTGGLRPGHLAILAALPKRFKTWFLIKAYVDQVLEGGNPIFFSLELSTEDIMGRIMCLLSGVSYSRWYRQELLPSEQKLIDQAAERMAELPGVISQPSFGERFVSNLVFEADREDASCIIIDQFSFLNHAGYHKGENEGYKEIVYDLKNAATIYEIPIYMAAQLNRQAVKENEFPIAQNLGLTRALEEASDLILGIEVSETLREEQMARIGVMEGRHCDSGPRARWEVVYEFNSETKFEPNI